METLASQLKHYNFDICRMAGALQAETPVSELERLRQEAVRTEYQIHCSETGTDFFSSY